MSETIALAALVLLLAAGHENPLGAYTVFLKNGTSVVAKEKYRLGIFGEVFNAFNIANLRGYGTTLDVQRPNPTTQTFAFGQPTQRALQTFGSAGPRAFQVGGRFSF